jgi:pimeloyl-ACP methyl ester carboxylesterase
MYQQSNVNGAAAAPLDETQRLYSPSAPKRRFAVAVLALSAALSVWGCGRHELLPMAPNSTEVSAVGSLDGSSDPLCFNRPSGPAQITGVDPHGALYALYRPANWNGDLVLYAHGYTQPQEPIHLPTSDFIEPLRDSLLAHHYAVAYSSFSKNGYAIEEGMSGTETVARIFAMRLGHPRRQFLIGHSLGGQIAMALAESHPFRYVGALTFSGVMGGTRREFGYVSNVRILFDYFYPGVLPGDLMHLPPNLDLNNDLIGPAVAAMTAHPEGAFAISQIAQTPVPFASGPELVESIVRAITLQAVELSDILERTHGESFFDNSTTVYTGALPPPVLDDINAHIARFEIAPSAAAMMRRFYEPTGRLPIPLIAYHTTRDPVVPVFHEYVYRDLVQAAGMSENLQQRIEDRYGHTGFPASQAIQAFEELVQWVNSQQGHHERVGELTARR